MGKVDLKKDLKNLYNPSVREVSVVEVPAMNFIMVDGAGDPNTAPEFKEAVEALYGTAYTLKFSLKKSGIGPEFAMMPLEGLWWMDDMSRFISEHKDLWKWTLMIALPDFIASEMIDEAIKQLRARKDSPAVSKVRFENLDEGTAVQMMHIGPYSEEAPNIAKVHEFARSNGYVLAGKHHEIYLSDPRRCAPEKMKTIIRQPVSRRAEG
jgi:hypothetical protein